MITDTIEAIINGLSFLDESSPVPSLSGGSMRQWRDTLAWLDSSGLSLYFLHRLRTRRMSGDVPEQALCQLEQRFARNTQRMAKMQRTFDLLNRSFSAAGIEYLVVKGFCLVPEYCQDASLRAQSDLDYLIPASSMNSATQVLVEHGFQSKSQTGQESVFWIPSEEPASSAVQYDPRTPFVIELHRSIWDESRFPLALRLPPVVFSPANLRQIGACVFPSLPDAHIFLHQILHAFQHVVTGRVRLCQFFEIAHFIHHSAGDGSFWNEVEALLSGPSLRHIAGLICAITQLVFPGRRPDTVNRWCDELRPPIRSWVESYSRQWLLEGAGESIRFFSSAKLVLFLQEQYMPYSHRSAWRMRTVVPVAGLRRIFRASRTRPTAPRSARLQAPWVLSRFLYHVGANLRYLYELPRWSRARKISAKCAPPHNVRQFAENGRLPKGFPS